MVVFKKQEGEQPLSFFCKICSKRFVSRRALGGHMRTHAPASMDADTVTETEFEKSKRPRSSNDESMDKEEDKERLDGNGTNLKYALRKNPKRSRWFADGDSDYSFLLGHGFDSKPFNSLINCDLCGKEFSSRKGLFSHMKCHCETHQDSGDAHIEQSQKHETQDEEEASDAEIEIDDPSGNSSKFVKWVKEKRLKRVRYAIQLNSHEQFISENNNEKEDMAMCLVMLASGVNTTQKPLVQVGAEEPGSGDLKLPHTGSQLPKCIMKKTKYKKNNGDAGLYDDNEAKVARYKCITCNKVFHSHQALGGHRASHNKVKGCFLQRREIGSLYEVLSDEELNTESDSQLPGKFRKAPPKERTKDRCVKARDEKMTIEPAAFSGKKNLGVHECSICHRVFASGQALGGHKRCHGDNAGAWDTISTISSNKDTPIQQQQMPVRVELLDLNLPAPVDGVDDDCDTGNLDHLSGNAVNSHGISDAQTHSPPSLQSWLMGNRQKQGLLYKFSETHLSEDDDADSKT